MRVLLIEDNEEVIHFLKPSLETACFTVDVAKDGASGSYLARTHDYDAIILDNVLPKKEGSEVCREIRQTGKTTPILMLSALSATDKKIELLNDGADDYMTKPFSCKELIARLRALMRRPKKINGDILQIDDLTLDSQRGTAKRAGKSIKLTKKEYELLEYLMRNQDSAIPRGMIMEHVWDINSDPFSNTIESHISSLRKKIKNGPGQKKLIYTLCGRGYKISATGN